MEPDLKRRDLGMLVLLMVVTFGFYGFYLIPKLGLSVNRLTRRNTYSFGLVLVIGIVTLGMGLTVFEILYAYNLEKNAGYTAGRWSARNLGGYVLVLNVMAFLLVFAPGFLPLVLSLFIGCWATWLIQNQVNLRLDLNEQYGESYA